MRVSDILEAKGRDVMTIQPGASIGHLSERLRDMRVGALVVSSDRDRVEGIISERDVVHGLAEYGADVYAKSVADLMTRSVVTCDSNSSISDVAGTMTRRRIRHLPVVNDGHLVGMVSIGDVLKTRIDEVQLEANVLRDVALAAR